MTLPGVMTPASVGVMTEQPATPTDMSAWRDLLAFALNTIEATGVDVWSVACKAGDSLTVHLDREDIDEARRLAAALGVDLDDAIERRTDTTFSVGSRREKPSYYREPGPYPFHGPSVPFGDRLVEVVVACGLPEDERHRDDEES